MGKHHLEKSKHLIIAPLRGYSGKHTVPQTEMQTFWLGMLVMYYVTGGFAIYTGYYRWHTDIKGVNMDWTRNMSVQKRDI
jgi:hypothetical protein